MTKPDLAMHPHSPLSTTLAAHVQRLVMHSCLIQSHRLCWPPQEDHRVGWGNRARLNQGDGRLPNGPHPEEEINWNSSLHDGHGNGVDSYLIVHDGYPARPKRPHPIDHHLAMK